MAKLKDYVELVTNNTECAILKVKDGCEMGMISLGYFNGNETLLRLTKGSQRTCTVFYKDGSNVSWYWGKKATMIVSDAVKKAGRMIEKCLTMDFDINMVENIEDTLYIIDYQSSIGMMQRFTLSYTHTNPFTNVLRDGVYLTTFRNYEDAENYIYKILEDIDDEGMEHSKNGAIIRSFTGIRKKVS